MSTEATLNLKTTDVKTFVPALNYDQSLHFYEALGWKIQYKDDGLALLELGESRFYLQNYYVKDWANNFMLHIDVADAKAWHEHASAVIAAGNYDHARLNEPKKMDYGPLVTHVWDPSGVLLHFAQWETE